MTGEEGAGRNPLKSGQAFKGQAEWEWELFRYLSQSPQIGSSVQSRVAAGDRTVGGESRNPLKSGQAFKVSSSTGAGSASCLGRNPLKSGQAFKAFVAFR